MNVMTDELMAGVNAWCRKEGRNGQHRQLIYLYCCICKEPSAPVRQFLSADLVRGHVAIHDS